MRALEEKIRGNQEKIRQNKVLPYLVGNVVEILEVDPEGGDDGAAQDEDSMRKGKCAVIKTSTRQTVFLPLIGLVKPEDLKPGDLIGVNKDSYLILDTLPPEFDSRVKAMEVDERPTEKYTVSGLSLCTSSAAQLYLGHWWIGEANRGTRRGCRHAYEAG